MIVCRVLCDSTHGSVGWSVGHVLLFSGVLRDSTPRFVGLSVRPSVRPTHFTFFGFLRSLASMLLPK